MLLGRSAQSDGQCRCTRSIQMPGKIGECRKVGFGSQPFGLEAAHLAARRRWSGQAPRGRHGAHGRIAGDPLCVVDCQAIAMSLIIINQLRSVVVIASGK